ncbi:hypothetical protein DYB28_014202 [Aphanomyces astaci]|uniref:Uncharacterized protein n=1 Tax=Aphanomyces astaci TaxID=112090 RepID=A0A397E5U7_APHAT|nr:hypothetical protein DYB36_007189 [Aphanomyces astaci]RHY42081.1 hypothetical protein DYB34_013274 [Aphanomyces astaci]RHY72045.1 hypothetical protein DYB38_012650 [Aphanomyces astaci]RHY73819.1 hypothetical protein DYB30_011337 [Aphanomyces astaci]RHZ11110.1 hypothetical protein DYB26_008412 [Aphanomyces astaci]
MVAWAIVGGLAIGAYLYTKPKPKHDDFHGSDSWNKNMDKNSPKKLAAWAIAGGIALAAYKYTQPPKHDDDFTDAASWNKKVLDKNAAKK